MSCEEDPLLPHRSNEEPLQAVSISAVAVACLSMLSFGYTYGYTNGILEPLRRDFNLSHVEVEVFVGMLNIGALPGALAACSIADYCGRKRCMALAAGLVLIGSVCMTFAPGYAVLMVGRVITGFAVGMSMVSGPLYTAEVSPSRLRGFLSTMGVEISLNLGIVIGSFWSLAFEWIQTESRFGLGRGWRWIIGVGLPTPIIVLFGILFIPESPRWLASQNRFAEAKDILYRLLGPIEAEITCKRIAEEQGHGECNETSWREMLTSKRLRWVVIAGAGVAFFSQANGIEAVVFYSSWILEEYGIPRRDALLYIFLIGVLNIITILISGVLVDRVGRKPLLMASATGMCVCSGALGVLFLLKLAWTWWISALALLGMYISFLGGYGPIVYTLNSEIYPSDCRTKGVTLAILIARVTGALVASTFLSLSDLLTMGGAFLLYSVVNALGASFVHCVVPETRGMLLEDVGERIARPGK